MLIYEPIPLRHPDIPAGDIMWRYVTSPLFTDFILGRHLCKSDGTAQKDAGNGGGARFFKPAFHSGKCPARGQDIVYQ